MRYFYLMILTMICFTTEVLAKDAKAAKKPAKASAGAPAGSRERVISREGQAKAGSKTKIDFEDTDIGGAAKTPYGTMLSNTKSNKNYDMVPIRTDWRPEMLQSASSLDAGRSR